MDKSDFDEFAELMHTVAELYDKQLSARVLMIYWGALEGHKLSDVREALKKHVCNQDTGQFMPKPADVIRDLPKVRGFVQ